MEVRVGNDYNDFKTVVDRLRADSVVFYSSASSIVSQAWAFPSGKEFVVSMSVTVDQTTFLNDFPHAIFVGSFGIESG